MGEKGAGGGPGRAGALRRWALPGRRGAQARRRPRSPPAAGRRAPDRPARGARAVPDDPLCSHPKRLVLVDPKGQPALRRGLAPGSLHGGPSYLLQTSWPWLHLGSDWFLTDLPVRKLRPSPQLPPRPPVARAGPPRPNSPAAPAAAATRGAPAPPRQRGGPAPSPGPASLAS